MKIFKRVLIGIFLLLALVAAGVFIYLQTLKPVLSGEVAFKGLAGQTEVLFDEYGVPHIYASSEEDAYAALGYVHAQDRLFQMEMLRRAAGGRLSEILGPEFIKIDKLFRTLGLNQFAKKNAEAFLATDTAAYQRAANAYLKGVNKYVAEGKTPIEFSVIGIPRAPFTKEDIYLSIAFMSLTFANGFEADPVLEKINREYGPEYLKDLAITPRADEVRLKSYYGAERIATDKIISALRNAFEKLPVSRFQGSNGWVVSADKSTSGSPILANDTHIGFGQPAIWYEAHLEYPGNSFYGHFLAGFPFGVLGNNRFCAWGFTMFENDDVDFFVETLNPEDSSEVKFQSGWEKMSTRTEIIKVKGGEDIALEVKQTRHGPLIDGIVDNVKEGNPVSVCWQLMEGNNEDIQALYELVHASTFSTVRGAISKIHSPGLNFMYGDVDGNIAWFAAAKLPIRPAHVQSKLFLDGSSGNDEYQGYYTFDQNPQSINPPEGFVYSANNQPDTVDGVLFPGYYFPKTRSGRLQQLLSADKKFSFDDMKTINMDNTSEVHGQIAQEIASILASTPANNELSDIIVILKNWKGDHLQSSTAPAVYYNMLSQIYFLAMKDELGKDALATLLNTPIMKNSVQTWLRNENSPWWDNVDTKDKKENISDILEEAGRRTLTVLKNTCGKNPESWTWGKIHTLTHAHALGKVKPLDKVFNVGPFSVDGGSEVINNLDFVYDTTGIFSVTVGPALRKITDLRNVENSQTVSPTGQSGNFMSPHYSDQAKMFATGKFRKMLMNRKEIESTSHQRLVLIP